MGSETTRLLPDSRAVLKTFAPPPLTPVTSSSSNTYVLLRTAYGTTTILLSSCVSLYAGVTLDQIPCGSPADPFRIPLGLELEHTLGGSSGYLQGIRGVFDLICDTGIRGGRKLCIEFLFLSLSKCLAFQKKDIFYIVIFLLHPFWGDKSSLLLPAPLFSPLKREGDMSLS